MSATDGSGNGGASAGIAQTIRGGPLEEVVLPADAAAPGAARTVIRLGTDTLRVEVEHPRTTDWFEMGRA